MKKFFILGWPLLIAGYVAIVANAQTNTNRISGVSSYWNTNTNGIVIIKNGRYDVTTNNQVGDDWVLVSGSSSNQPHWKLASTLPINTTNITGQISGANIYGPIFGTGISTNLTVLRPGPLTNTLVFTNGVLIGVQ